MEKNKIDWDDWDVEEEDPNIVFKDELRSYGDFIGREFIIKESSPFNPRKSVDDKFILISYKLYSTYPFLLGIYRDGKKINEYAFRYREIELKNND